MGVPKIFHLSLTGTPIIGPEGFDDGEYQLLMTGVPAFKYSVGELFYFLLVTVDV